MQCISERWTHRIIMKGMIIVHHNKRIVWCSLISEVYGTLMHKLQKNTLKAYNTTSFWWGPPLWTSYGYIYTVFGLKQYLEFKTNHIRTGTLFIIKFKALCSLTKKIVINHRSADPCVYSLNYKNNLFGSIIITIASVFLHNDTQGLPHHFSFVFVSRLLIFQYKVIPEFSNQSFYHTMLVNWLGLHIQSEPLCLFFIIRAGAVHDEHLIFWPQTLNNHSTTRANFLSLIKEMRDYSPP